MTNTPAAAEFDEASPFRSWWTCAECLLDGFVPDGAHPHASHGGKTIQVVEYENHQLREVQIATMNATWKALYNKLQDEHARDKAEAAQLRKDNEMLIDRAANRRREVRVVNADLAALRSRIEGLRLALDWYADSRHWESTTHDSTRDGCGCTDFTSMKIGPGEIVQVGGRRARETLSADDAAGEKGEG